MARFDMPEAELRSYRPVVSEPADFDAFWGETLADARSAEGSASVTPLESPFTTVRVSEVRFPGFGGAQVGAWLLVPDGPGGHPAVVQFQGYGSGRGLPHEWLAWPSAGFATLVVDTRGQEAARSSGRGTPDPAGSAASVPGFVTRGIEDPNEYYYRRVLTDAVRAVDFLAKRPEIDAARILVGGVSQGGGISLAVAGLHPDVAGCVTDVPFLCHFERAVGLTDAEPYAEITRYLRAHRASGPAVARTLSYFDGISFAARAKAPALFSVALQDVVCPPSTVFAAYNSYAGPKEIVVYPFNGHEGGGADQWPLQLAFARALDVTA